MIRPALERAPHFICVLCSVVRASNASTMSWEEQGLGPGIMVQDCFDVVGLYAKLAKLRSSGST
jgi:hypothetical protein